MQRGKTGEISRWFCWCGSFQLSVCGLTIRLFALKVLSQRPQDFTPELCTATLILGTILLFSLQVTGRNSKLVKQDRLTKKLSAVYVSLRLLVKFQMHTCKRPGNFQGTNQTDTVFAFYRYSQVTFSHVCHSVKMSSATFSFSSIKDNQVKISLQKNASLCQKAATIDITLLL